MRALSILLLVVVLAGCSPPQKASRPAGAKLSERDHVERWAAEHGGEVEVTMPDRTRCDLVTATHAIEFDFADKWAESIGQSLNYAFQTNKRAGIVLIVRDEKDYPKYVRVNSLVEHYELPIDVWMIKAAGSEK